MNGAADEFTLDNAIELPPVVNLDYVLLLMCVIILTAILSPIACTLRDVVIVLSSIIAFGVLFIKVTKNNQLVN